MYLVQRLTYLLTTGTDNITGTAGNDTVHGLLGNEIVGGTLVSTATLSALDMIDGAGGNDTLNVVIQDTTKSVTGLNVSNVETINVRSVGDATADTSTGFTGLTALNLTQSVDATATAADTTDISVAGATGDILINGAKNVVVNDATKDKNITVGATTVNKGTITVTDTKQGTGAIAVDGGTDVTITATSTATGTITVGQGGAAADMPSGVVTVVQNLNSDGTGGDLTGGAITATGGSAVNVTVNATSTAKNESANDDIAIGAVSIMGDGKTTAVSTKQNKAITTSTKDAVGGSVETASVKFGALKSGDAVTVAGLTFTASKDLTAVQVAEAFAGLTASDKQDAGGPTANGVYTNTLSGWTSAAASGDTVVFTSTTAASTSGTNVTDISVSLTDNGTSGDSTAPVVTTTQGVDVTSAKTTSTNTIAFGAVRVEDNATAAITSLTIDGFASAEIGIEATPAAGDTKLDALTSLTLKNNTPDGDVSVATDSKTLTLSLDNITKGSGTSALINLDHDGNSGTSATIETLTINTMGTKSDAVITSAATKSLTVDAGVNLDISNGGTQTIGTSNALQTVVVKGAGNVNLGTVGSTGLKSFTAADNTGGVTANIVAHTAGVHADFVSYTFSQGADVVNVTNATVDKAINLGAGDDFIALAGTTLNKTVDGGTGTNTLYLSAANAQAASSASTFETKIDNFQKLSIGSVSTSDITVDLSNMDDISHVISAGGSVATGGTKEVTTATFTALNTGASITIAGKTVTASQYLSAANVADAMSGATVTGATVSGSFTGWAVKTHTAGSNAIVFEATAVGNETDLSATSLAGTQSTTPTVNTTTQGAAATAEEALVSFGSLTLGESVTVGGRVVTAAATNETVVVSGSAAFDAGDTLTINGAVYTASAALTDSYAAIIAAAVNADGSAGTGWTLSSGTPTYGWDSTNSVLVALTTGDITNLTTADIIFTNDPSGTPTTFNPSSVTVTNGSDGSLTAANVRDAVISTASSGIGWTATGGAVSGYTLSTAGLNANQLKFTNMTAGNQTDISVVSTGNQPTVAITQGIDAATEAASVTFQALASGQTVSVAGRTVTATNADLTAAQVEAAFLAGTTIGAATVGGNLSGWTVASNGTVSDGILTFTSTSISQVVTDLTASVINASAPTTSIFSAKTDGTPNSGTNGSLTLTKMANNGTLELTAAAALTTVTMTDATGTADSMNVKATVGASDINFGTVAIAGVETIAINANDSNVDEDSDTITYETGDRDTATLTLKANEAKTVNVDGNASLTLAWDAVTTKVTMLDASTLAGSLTAETVATKTMTIKGGTAADALTAKGQSDVLLGGDGADTLTVAAGANLATLTGGAGADKFVIGGASTNVNNAATITDALSGDVIQFTGATSFKAAGLSLDSTAVFQDYANAAIVSGNVNQMVWFNYGGNTYIVMETSSSDANDSFVNGTDVVVKITGTLDLSTGASYNATSNTLEIA